MSQSTVDAADHDTAVPAPAHFRAVVNDDDSIDTAWEPVPGSGITYTLKETASPHGVQGATGLTATHSHRTPHTHREYEYWVVAVRDGVESADSAHVRVTLPHEPPPHLQSGSTPADILQIGGVGGHWQLDIGPRKTDADSVKNTFGDACKVDQYGRVTVAESGLRHAHDRYFRPAPGGNSVTFTSYMDGAVKPNTGHSGSDYPRTELRELGADGDTTTWDAGTVLRTLSGRTAVLAMPSYKREICVAQIHGSKSDTLELRVEGPDGDARDGFTWVVNWSDGNDAADDHPEPTEVKHGYRLGDEVAWEIRVDHGSVSVRIDGTEQFAENFPVDADHHYRGQFFKTGCYCQTNVRPKGHHAGDNEPDDFQAITLRDLRLARD
jgi:Alginate lyase